jgi:ATP-dependent DNA helicase RecG
MVDFKTPVGLISGIGQYYQKKLEKLGIKTVRDLFYHFPARYEDFSNFKNIEELEVGETATISGQILDIKTRRSWQRKIFITEALVQDETDSMRVIWFNQPFLSQNLKPGDLVSLAGKVAENEKGIYLSAPAYEKISQIDEDRRETGRLIPIYPETKGLTSRALRFFIKKLLEQIRFPADPLPIELKQRFEFPDIKTALQNIHFPAMSEEAEAAKKRFSFEDLFLLELLIFRERQKLTLKKSFSIRPSLEILKKFVDSLSFDLTGSQRRSIFEILRDLQKNQPMNRLLEGDVGSGKTIVAAIASLAVIKNKFQVVLMAPTEILSRQHFQTCANLFKDWEINIGLITSSETKIAYGALEAKNPKKDFLKKCESGELNLIIGTHALIQKNVKFQKLGLIIIDEQHRFGVEQRRQLLENNKNQELIPHLLSMTATPIPRTLALTIWGDLDISLINEMPKNRKSIITKLAAPINRQKAYDFVRRQIKLGRQAFVVCPLIEDSPKLEVKSVTQEYEKLKKRIFPDLKIQMLHGKMKAKEKEEVMRNFNDGKIDVLVSTSVIEVGIDIPNATIMLIEGADRFGLAQIYQFRGRVGRGQHQSYCLLFTESATKSVQERLGAIVKAKNSFELAERDLQIRGPGEFLGTRQSGIPDYLMNALKNLELVQLARDEAKKILEKDPNLNSHLLIKNRLVEFGQTTKILN